MTNFVRIFIMIVICHICASSKILGINESLYFLKKTAPIILTIILAKLLMFPVPYVIEGNYSILVLNSVSKVINPNQLAQLIAVILFLLVTTLKENNKILSIACIVFSIIILFLLKSRTSLYATLAVSASYLLFVSGRIKFKHKLIIACCAILFVALQLLTAIQLDSTGTITHKESKEMSIASLVASGGSGRIFTWKVAISDIIPQHPQLGIGLGSENYEALGYEYDCDNLFLDLIVETGFIGFALFFVFYIITTLEVHRGNDKTGKIIKYLLFMILCFGIGETVFDSFFMWSIVFLCYIYLFSNNQSYQYGKSY
ncbi:MAG: O-antigen ligase family protein [Prevotellaceae bacterium]|nr:O-antigen ligase family protein [Prevotellaceae bacterium]